MPKPDFDITTFLQNNVHYPEKASRKHREGRVKVSFVVNEDGSVSQVEVLNHVSPELDREAERVVTAMPHWTPGKKDGKPVRVRYTLPINFKMR